MENLLATERRQRAIEAATAIAATYGITSDAPVILHDSNNTVVHLIPFPIVAKIATSTVRKQKVSNLTHELNVALHLATRDAPIVPPSTEIPSVVHEYDDLEVTFWQHSAGEKREEIDLPRMLAAVMKFHAAFAEYPGELESFTKNYEECYSMLDSERLSPELTNLDRRFLGRVYEDLHAKLQTFEYDCIPAHEEIHNGNVLWVGADPLLIDFESCVLAPREIDFLAFSDTNLPAQLHLDRSLMDILRRLKSFSVAVWCWSQPDRAPEIREAAEYHLSRLRGLYPRS